MTWVVQLSSKRQESLMTVVKIFQVFVGVDPKSRNDGMAESRNGGKFPQILKYGIAESRNHGTAENTPRS